VEHPVEDQLRQVALEARCRIQGAQVVLVDQVAGKTLEEGPVVPQAHSEFLADQEKNSEVAG